MKHIISAVVLLFLTTIAQAQTGTIRGTVRSLSENTPLVGANIWIAQTQLGTATDTEGRFMLSGIPPGEYQLVASYIGFSTKTIRARIESGDTLQLNIRLDREIISGPRVEIIATRAQERKNAVPHAELSKQAIDARYTVQDMPQLLSELPSTTWYSEGGNGLGYNYLSIRGFGQRRISVMINGVPQNDPEDHNVYWIDFPDFTANVQSIQVQRGAGSAFYGPPAIGGSINIQTAYFSPEKELRATVAGGSFATRKFSLSYNTGVLKDKYVFYARVSQLKSDGYRDNAWVDFRSYFFGAARYDENSSLRLHIYGGPIQDGLAYYGIPRDANKDDSLRRSNVLGKTDIENFNQPHYELLYERTLSKNLRFNSSLFYIRGYGFFDYGGSWGTPEYFRLTPEYGYSVDSIPADAVIRAWVENNQVGWLPQLALKHKRGELIIGAEMRYHRSLHWGRLQAGSGLPEGVVGERRYYEYKGGKDILSAYAHETWNLRPNLVLTADVQYTFKQYRLFDEKFIGTDFRVPYHFVNPRLGLNYNASPKLHYYASISRTSREPRLKNLYDAAEASTPASWGAVVPEFATGPDGQPDFSKPLVRPETLMDYEAGVGWRSQRVQLALNLYYMDFRDEIIKKGGLDRFGQPRTGNAERTLHKGVELSAQLRLTPRWSLSGNAMFASNRLVRYTVYNSSGEALRLDGNPIAGFPDVLGNLRLTYAWGGLYLSLAGKYVGGYYTDNFKNQDNYLDPYTVLDLNFSVDLAGIGLKGLALKGTLSNLLDRRYLMHGEGAEFYPAATRSGIISVEFSK